MSITEIKTEIERLPEAELAAFGQWFEEFQADTWDRQIERDIKAGCLDAIAREVDEQAEAGLCWPSKPSARVTWR